ncbi:PHP domain-containing protein [Patescibacteria group bacterium]|nr:PHP domain-containing protein [Patescibacteria group bacterium]
MMIDLHFHSYYSDGIDSPADLAKKAKEIGLTTVCLTDHNAINGYQELLTAGQSLGLNVITGVEIYTNYKDKRLHLLGYDFNPDDQDLNLNLKELQEKHLPQVKETIDILKNDGWNIEEKDVFDSQAAYIGIANIAGLLPKDAHNWERIKKDFNWHQGKIIPITEIIAKYFYKEYSGNSSTHKNKCPIYVEAEMPIEKAINLIKQAGGKAVLAHPGQHLSWREDQIVAELRDFGLAGLEAISSHHSWQQIEHWQILAKELDLLITVGSDFHGQVPEDWQFLVRSPWDFFKVNKSDSFLLFNKGGE